MSSAKSTWLAISAAAFGVAIGVTGSAIAQLGMPMYMKSDIGTGLATLNNNEGVYVDKGTFKLRVGTAKALTLMEGRRWNQGLLEELSVAMADASICGLGQAAPNPIRCVMKYFPKEIE